MKKKSTSAEDIFEIKDLAPCYHWLDERGDPLLSMEILSPASVSTYKQAVYGGADAIYFGYGELNARASADNFTTSLVEVVSFCHLYGVKAFLTLNIALKDGEIEEAERIIIEGEKAKIDAFIITDLTLIPLIKKHSKAQIHASTQCGIHNTFGTYFCKELGFDRAVLSREISYQDLQKVGYMPPIDLEMFVHGALCVAFSGACLFSSMATGNSGNRGRCNQFCRMFYRGFIDGTERASGYLLSAKDICMADCLDKIAENCVCSGKIEGRLRRPEYTLGVTSYYKDIKLGVQEGISEQEMKSLFNRGDFTKGYFENNDVVYPYSPTNIGIYVGKVEYLINPHTALVRAKRPLEKMDGLKLLRKDVEVSGCSALGEKKNGCSVIYCTENIKIGDCVHLTTDSTLIKRLSDIKKPLVLSLIVRIIGGEKPYVHIRHEYFCTECDFDFIVDKAISHPLTAEEIKEQFSKTGDTDFAIDFAYIETKDAFLAKSQLNAMRRQILETYEKYALSLYKRASTNNFDGFPIRKGEKTTGDFAEVKGEEYLSEYLAKNVENIVYSPENFEIQGAKLFYNKAKEIGHKTVFVRPPVYVSERDAEKCREIIRCFDGVICNNLGLVYVAMQENKLTVAGQNLNIMNSRHPLIDMCNNYFISPELNKGEIRSFQKGILYVYGKIPLMFLSFCPRKQMGIKCASCYGKVEYKDDFGTYAVQTTRFEKGRCLHMLKNSSITDIGNIYREKDFYFDFTESTKEDIEQTIFNYYENGMYSPLGTNKLHLTRGVK